MSIKFVKANHKVFRARLAEAKAVHPHGAAVNLYSEHEYAGMRTFLSPDGLAGYAISGKDMVSVFKHPRAPYGGVGAAAAEAAAKNGANTADAYDVGLPEMYSKAGFRAVARIPFDPKEKPADFKEEDFKEHNNGRPDVVFMVHDPQSAGVPYDKTHGVKVGTWDEGVAAQQSELDKIAKRNSAFNDGAEGGR
jgi:hypothetical protein